MTRPLPDLTGARYESVRRKVDHRYLAMVRDLEDAYYGTARAWDAAGNATRRTRNGWCYGYSHPVTIGGKTFDKAETREVSKARFDVLHGDIWAAHELELYDQSIADQMPYGDIHMRTEVRDGPAVDMRIKLRTWGTLLTPRDLEEPA